jgi:hypothetical protein
MDGTFRELAVKAGLLDPPSPIREDVLALKGLVGPLLEGSTPLEAKRKRREDYIRGLEVLNAERVAKGFATGEAPALLDLTRQ